MHCNRIIKKSVPAFSLIEMIVSVSIIALVSSIFFANYQGNIRRSDLVMTTNILAADTRLAQTYSLGLMKYDTIFPDGGWGIDLSSNEGSNDRYYFFADGYDNLADNIRQENESLAVYKGKQTLLPPDIRIQNIQIKKNGAWLTTNHITVTFVPPRPRTDIYNVSGSYKCEEALVTLINNKDNTTMKLSVNFAGLIDTIQ